MHEHEHDHGAEPASFSTELLDLDGEVLHEYWDEALGWVRELAGDPKAIVDLGAGSGVGTLRLAKLFPNARVTAVDIDETLLTHIRERAAEAGVGDRVQTVAADLDHGLPELGQVDVTWASMSLHHFADPHDILRAVYASTNPGGLIALAEFSEVPRVLPESSNEQRWLDLLRDEHRHALPHLGAEWAPRLTSAGFEVVGERDIQLRASEPSEAAGRYAQLWLQRLSERLNERVDEADRAELAELVADHGPRSVRNRDDLAIRGVRTVTIARRS